MARFRFSGRERRKEIVKFVDTLCKETPEIAAEMLNVPIKHVSHWLATMDGASLDPADMTTLEIAQAPCGCLVGSALIATARLYPEVIDAVRKTPLPGTEDSDADWDVAETAAEITAGALYVVDGEFGGLDDRDISNLGVTVANEVYNDEKEFDEFVKNRIREKLGL